MNTIKFLIKIPYLTSTMYYLLSVPLLFRFEAKFAREFPSDREKRTVIGQMVGKERVTKNVRGS